MYYVLLLYRVWEGEAGSLFFFEKRKFYSGNFGLGTSMDVFICRLLCMK